MPRNKRRGEELSRQALSLPKGSRDTPRPQPSARDIEVAKRLLCKADTCREKFTRNNPEPDRLHKALDIYRQGLAKMLGDEGQQFIPGRPDAAYRNDFYTKLNMKARNILLSLCSGVVQSLVDLGPTGYLEMLTWYDELDFIFTNLFCQKPACDGYDWALHYHTPAEITKSRCMTLFNWSTVIGRLGNTGRAQYIMCIADRFLRCNKNLSRHEARMVVLATNLGRSVLTQALHPDPLCLRLWRDSERQLGLALEGAWTKLPIRVDEDMGRRAGHGSFIWKSHLYIIGGRWPAEPETHDVWRLNLEKPESWEYLCKCPAPSSPSNLKVFQRVKIYRDKAYIFWGEPLVHYYDLNANEWGSFLTKFAPTEEDKSVGIGDWPWEGNLCFQAAQEFVQGRLLCFGGANENTHIGCNLLMELDLETKMWRRVNGFPSYQERNSPNLPPGRIGAGSWVSRDQRRFYILFGEGNASSPKPGDRFGPKEPWNFDDLWSWDLVDQQSRRERICGNPPAPRAAMGCVYNEKVDRVIVYGGSNVVCHHASPRTGERSNAIIYGDTFVWQPPPADNIPDYDGQHRWQQVISWGYPTHRFLHQLVCDPDTGKIYIYGGVASTKCMPSKSNYVLRAFGDVWQLHLDLPGGDFESIDLADQERTAPIGPWRRCFNCSNIGEGKECGGSCGGKAFFCGRDCLVQGWGEHKRLHGCRKR